jgi:hypothetical protein
MNILPAHLAALCQFGYSDQEAMFIYLVATHSGAGSCTLGAWASEFNSNRIHRARKNVRKKESGCNSL